MVPPDLPNDPLYPSRAGDRDFADDRCHIGPRVEGKFRDAQKDHAWDVAVVDVRLGDRSDYLPAALSHFSAAVGAVALEDGESRMEGWRTGEAPAFKATVFRRVR